VDPADIPPEKVAHRLHLTPEEFIKLLPNLFDRGFPRPDPDTGNYGLDAVDLWRRRRDGLLPELTAPPLAGDDITTSRAVERFHAATAGREAGSERWRYLVMCVRSSSRTAPSSSTMRSFAARPAFSPAFAFPQHL
jgi:hypothetical protein